MKEEDNNLAATDEDNGKCDPEAADKESFGKAKKYLVFVGNPGVGKSVIARALFKKESIQYGPTQGEGNLTSDVEEAAHPEDDTFIGVDLPGIDDKDQEVRHSHDELLRKALQRDSTCSFQIVFVVRLHNGRVVRQEDEMLRRVLESLKQGADSRYGITDNQYGIVVNQVDDDTWSAIEDEESDTKRKLEKAILADLPLTTTHIHFQNRYDGMSYAHNKNAGGTEPELPLELLTFLQKLPINIVLSDHVAIKTFEDVLLDGMLAKVREGHLQQWLEWEKEKEAREQALLDAATWRHPLVLEYTWCLVVPAGALLVVFFVFCCFKYQPWWAPILAAMIPLFQLQLGQMPKYVTDGTIHPMTVWAVREMRDRGANLTLDMWSLHEQVRECLREDVGIFSLVLLVVYVLSVILELSMCNLGGSQVSLQFVTAKGTPSEIRSAFGQVSMSLERISVLRLIVGKIEDYISFQGSCFLALDHCQQALSFFVALDVGSASALFACVFKFLIDSDIDRVFDLLERLQHGPLFFKQFIPFLGRIEVALKSKTHA